MYLDLKCENFCHALIKLMNYIYILWVHEPMLPNWPIFWIQIMSCLRNEFYLVTTVQVPYMRLIYILHMNINILILIDMTFKSLRRLFPFDDSMVVIMDDRADIWQWCPNLIKISACKFVCGSCLPYL